MVDNAVAVRGHFAGGTEAWEVGGDAAGYRGDVGDYVAPEIGGSGVAVEEESSW